MFILVYSSGMFQLPLEGSKEPKSYSCNLFMYKKINEVSSKKACSVFKPIRPKKRRAWILQDSAE